MLGLVFATLWRRRAQSALLLVLATVAAAGAATAPGYVTASLQSLAAASVTDAPVPDRVVSAATDAPVTDHLTTDLSGFADKVRATLQLPGFTSVSGAAMVAVVSSSLQKLVYRDDVCKYLAIEGACPTTAGEVLLPATLADQLEVRVGDVLPLRGRTEIPPVPMKVVGRYRPLDPFEPYWGYDAGTAVGERQSDVAIFTPLATFGLLRPNQVDLTVDLVATPDAYRGIDPRSVAAAAEHGELILGTAAIHVTSGLRRLTDRLGDEQRLVVDGVIIGVGELLVVCWLALFLAVRRTAETRRGDLGLLKLRGTRRRDLWLLVAGQTLLPLVAGGLIGLAVGPWLARWLAGPVAVPPVPLTLLAAAVAVLGAAVAALAAERRTIGESVSTLSRRVGRPRLGRLAILDAIVVLLAVAGAYQASVAGSGGLALLAPLLLALAVGVLAARLVPLAANRLGGRSLRAGRLSTGLTAMHLARRTGTASVLGVVVVVVAVLTSTALAWTVAGSARADRAVAEIGAPRVLTVRSAGPHQLLTAVRAADPDGRSAMAVVRTDAAVGTVLALDTTRLAAFTPRLAAYGLPDWPGLAATLHPSGYPAALIRADLVTLDATWSPGAAPSTTVSTATPTEPAATASVPAASVVLKVRLVGPDGVTVESSTGRLLPGRNRYPVPTTGCAPGCRLVALTLAADVGAPTAELTVHALTGVDDQTLLTDRTRWRAGLAEAAQVPDIAITPDGLRLSIGPGVPAGAGELSAAAYVADAPTPLPVVRGGEVGLDRADPRTAVLGNDVVPVRLAGAGQSLPAVGTGLLADLEYADRLGTRHQEATQQVWLADTPAAEAVVQRLTAAGIVVVGDETIAGRQAALNARGPATALRFLFAVALVLVAMGLLSFAVAAAAERRTRGLELAALRRQGLAARVVRRVGLAGYPGLGLLAVAIGVLTGLLIDRLVPAQLPLFADTFASAPAGSPAVVVLLVAATAAVAFTVVAAAAGLALVSSVRRLIGASPWSG